MVSIFDHRFGEQPFFFFFFGFWPLPLKKYAYPRKWPLKWSKTNNKESFIISEMCLNKIMDGIKRLVCRLYIECVMDVRIDLQVKEKVFCFEKRETLWKQTLLWWHFGNGVNFARQSFSRWPRLCPVEIRVLLPSSGHYRNKVMRINQPTVGYIARYRPTIMHCPIKPYFKPKIKKRILNLNCHYVCQSCNVLMF